MLTCRSISEEVWRHARQVLIFYFSRRGLVRDAEDLAHKTLLALFKRQDFQFEKEDDFLKVCFGFARLVLKEGRREVQKHEPTAELDTDVPAPNHQFGSFRSIEDRIMLDEVLEIGARELDEEDWLMLERILDPDRDAATDPVEHNSSRLRVSLFRARKRLNKLTGWRKRGVTTDGD